MMICILLVFIFFTLSAMFAFRSQYSPHTKASRFLTHSYVWGVVMTGLRSLSSKTLTPGLQKVSREVDIQ